MCKYNVTKSIIGQAEYCERNDAPHFAPRSGTCWNCYMNIYEQKHWEFLGGMDKRLVGKSEAKYSTGITTLEATESLVTGCPHCNRSYCD